MKRIMIGLVAATASLSLLAGCGSNDPGTTTPGTTAPGTTAPGGTNNSDVIKIGINYELSGDVATYGEDATQGAEMAIDEVNAAGGIGGKQIELVKYDNKSDPAEATTLATKLMTQDKVLAVIGPATSGNFKATIPVATANKVPVVSGSATADDVTVGPNGVNEYAFRTCFNDSFQGTAMANYATQKLGAKNVVIIKDNSSDYAKGLAATFTETFTANGGTIVGEDAYVGGDKDFSAMLTRVRSMSFDAIYLPGYYQEVGLIIKAARDLGITAPVLGADGFDSPVLLDLGGAAALNDVYFTNHYSSLDTDPKVVDFIAAFKAKFNEEPNAFHAGGYDTANFVIDAIQRATAETGEAVKDAMAATKDFVAVTGTLTVDANHNPVKDIVVIELKDGVQACSERIKP
jgi:branched-chain amino acid transport system substrate-binding protein